MDIKCKLCESSFETDEELNGHWEGLHNKEWRELQRELDMGDHVRSHRYLADEGMRGFKWGEWGIGVVRYTKKTLEERRWMRKRNSQ